MSGATFDAEHFEQDAPGSNPSLERLFCDSRVATYFRLEAGVARGACQKKLNSF